MIPVRFGDLKIGDTFECYGDEHLNYNYPKICKCAKTDAFRAQEIGGIYFLMNAEDKVMVGDEQAM